MIRIADNGSLQRSVCKHPLDTIKMTLMTGIYNHENTDRQLIK